MAPRLGIELTRLLRGPGFKPIPPPALLYTIARRRIPMSHLALSNTPVSCPSLAIPDRQNLWILTFPGAFSGCPHIDFCGLPMHHYRRLRPGRNPRLKSRDLSLRSQVFQESQYAVRNITNGSRLQPPGTAGALPANSLPMPRPKAARETPALPGVIVNISGETQ